MARAGAELGRNFQVRQLGQGVRQQAKLQFARQRQVAFQSLLLPGDLLVQPRILNRDRDLRRQGRHRAVVIVGKKSPPGMLQVEHSDDFVFVNQRHGQLRAGLRIHHDVARVLADIRDQHRLPVPRGVTHQSIPHRNVMLDLYIFLKAQGKPVLQFFSRCVQQQDAEHLVVDQPAEQFGNALEQFVHIQNRAQLARDLVQ